MQNQNKWSFWENSRLRCFVANFIADGFTRFFVLFFLGKKCVRANFYTFRMSGSALFNIIFNFLIVSITIITDHWSSSSGPDRQGFLCLPPTDDRGRRDFWKQDTALPAMVFMIVWISSINAAGEMVMLESAFWLMTIRVSGYPWKEHSKSSSAALKLPS